MNMAPPTTRPQPSDPDLLAGLRAGEEAAFEAFVRRFCDPMYYVARRLVGTDVDAADVMQEAFLLAFRGMSRFDGRAALATWLHRIVVNAAIQKLRTAARRPTLPLDAFLPHFDDTDHHAIEPVAIQASVEQLLARKELKAVVHAQIERLPESYRTVVLLRDIEGMSTEDVAEVLGVTVAVVKTRLHRARQALRTLLDPHFREGGHDLP